MYNVRDPFHTYSIYTYWGPFRDAQALRKSRWYTLIHFPRLDPDIIAQNPHLTEWGGRKMHCVHPIPTRFLQHLHLEELQYLELILAENLAAIMNDDAQMGFRVDETLERIRNTLNEDWDVGSYKEWRDRVDGEFMAHLRAANGDRNARGHVDDGHGSGEPWWKRGLWRALRPVYTTGATPMNDLGWNQVVDHRRENEAWN